MDRIKIRDLDIYAYHGAIPEENVVGQRFLISADLYVDTRKAGQTDDLTCSVHYGDVCHLIRREMTEHTFLLIERAAHHLADRILLSFPLIQKITLEVKKPQAPVGLPFGMISVEVNRGWERAVIALGSNQGDRASILEGAVQLLREDERIRILRTAEPLETEPWGYTEQETFLNGALLCETLYSPEELLDKMQETEDAYGRTREVHWGPRTLDLDLIFYGNEVIHTGRLEVPHPYMQERSFVLDPLCQIIPEWRHPVYGKTVYELAQDCRRRDKETEMDRE